MGYFTQGFDRPVLKNGPFREYGGTGFKENDPCINVRVCTLVPPKQKTYVFVYITFEELIFLA